MNEPLTDYLDALSENHMGSRSGDWCTGCGADWPCFERQAIEELRERRQAMSMCADVEADLAELREQNAKLVEALKEYGDHLPQRVGEDCLGPVWDSETKTLGYRPCVCGFDAALASAKGEPPRYGFNCEPGCPGCPNCEGTA